MWVSNSFILEITIKENNKQRIDLNLVLIAILIILSKYLMQI